MEDCDLIVWGFVVLFVIFSLTICSLEGLHQSRVFYHWIRRELGEDDLVPSRADSPIL